MKFTVISFLVWRIFLFVPLLFGSIFLETRTGYLFKGINNFILFPWANFDGVHYLSIAANGYTTEGRFFPLFPLLINKLGFFSRNISEYFFIGFLISNLAFLGSLFVFYKLIRLDFTDKVARWSIIFLLVFPTSFYFGAIYSESLFLLLLLLSFYFARKGKWWLAAVCGLLLSLTRVIGILILPVLLFELFQKYGFFIKNKWQQLRKILPLLTSPLGFVAFGLFCQQKWGDFFYFIHNQGSLDNSRSVSQIILFPQSLVRYYKILASVSILHYEWWVALLELASFLFAGLMVYLAYRRKINSPYLLFSFLALLVPASTGTFSGLPRYILVIFPIYVVLAMQNSFFRRLFLPVSAGLLLILTTLFMQGYFVA